MRYLGWSLSLAFVLLCSACTHTPWVDDSKEAYVDSSTPSQYPPNSSGLLYETPDHKGIYITANRAKGEPTAIAVMDKYGNPVFLISTDVLSAEYDKKTEEKVKRLESIKPE